MTLADVGRELGNAGIGAQRSKGLSEKWKRLYCDKLRMAAIRTNACALQSNFFRIVAHNRVRRSDKASNRRGEAVFLPLPFLHVAANVCMH